MWYKPSTVLCPVQEEPMRRVPSTHPGDQPDLFQPCPETPGWAHLPLEARQQTLRLLVQLLRQHRRELHVAAREQEVCDE
jgi:acyl-CoA reductase-like NAD-dependent aldehyde dehydrogenase